MATVRLSVNTTVLQKTWVLHAVYFQRRQFSSTTHRRPLSLPPAAEDPPRDKAAEIRPCFPSSRPTAPRRRPASLTRLYDGGQLLQAHSHGKNIARRPWYFDDGTRITVHASQPDNPHDINKARKDTSTSQQHAINVSLLKSCHEIYTEALPILYEVNTIVMPHLMHRNARLRAAAESTDLVLAQHVRFAPRSHAIGLPCDHAPHHLLDGLCEFVPRLKSVTYNVDYFACYCSETYAYDFFSLLRGLHAVLEEVQCTGPGCISFATASGQNAPSKSPT